MDDHIAEHANKSYDIVVNGRPKTVDESQLSPGHELSFEAIVSLAFPDPPTGPQVMFTVAYRRAEGNKSGTVAPGKSIKIKDGVIFDVTATDKS
jgi:hypothetical protein